MNKISIRAVPKKFNNGSYLLLPATPADRNVLNSFAENVGNKYVRITFSEMRPNKTYDQVKTVFALIDLRYFIKNHRYPTDTEQAYEYSCLLWKYAEREVNPLNPNESGPITLSKMSKSQAASFISGIIADIYEYSGDMMTDTQAVEIKEIFEEFLSAAGVGAGNPIDYDENGNMLSEEEWRKKNHFSFASGVVTEDLQLHHIIARTHPVSGDCSWNWMMLTDYEHNRLIHSKGGWQKFLMIYPHLANRVKNAFDMAHEIYPLEVQQALLKLGLIDEMYNDIEPEEAVVKDNLTTESLADLALADEKQDYDIF